MQEYKFTRGVSYFSTNDKYTARQKLAYFIDIEISKMLRVEGKTLKGGNDVINKNINKSNEYSSCTGSENRSVRHIKASTFYKSGFIINSNEDNIANASFRDLASGFGGKKNNNITKLSKDEIRNYLIECERREKGSFKGEVILKNIIPDMIEAIYFDKNNKSTFLLASNKIAISPVIPLAMQQKFEKYTGKKLPIIDFENNEKLNPEQLEQKIKRDINSNYYRDTMEEMLIILTKTPELFNRIKTETNNFEKPAQGFDKSIKNIAMHTLKTEEKWNKFMKELDGYLKDNDKWIDSAERRGMINLENINEIKPQEAVSIVSTNSLISAKVNLSNVSKELNANEVKPNSSNTLSQNLSIPN